MASAKVAFDTVRRGLSMSSNNFSEILKTPLWVKWPCCNDPLFRFPADVDLRSRFAGVSIGCAIGCQHSAQAGFADSEVQTDSRTSNPRVATTWKSTSQDWSESPLIWNWSWAIVKNKLVPIRQQSRAVRLTSWIQSRLLGWGSSTQVRVKKGWFPPSKSRANSFFCWETLEVNRITYTFQFFEAIRPYLHLHLPVFQN